MADTHSESEAREIICRWVEGAIIGHQLCPFAAAPWRQGKVGVDISHAISAEEAVRDCLDAAWQLLEPAPDEGPAPPRPETVLIGFPAAGLSFQDLLDVSATAEAILEQAGGRGLLQLLTFHPDYVFEGEAPDDPSVWTNRSPIPVLHLLREDEVSRAVAQHPDTLAIPERNVRHLRALGLDALRTLWRTFEQAPSAPSRPDQEP